MARRSKTQTDRNNVMLIFADGPALSGIKQRLSDELDRWMQAQGDPGEAMDTIQAYKAARHGSHIYGPKR